LFEIQIVHGGILAGLLFLRKTEILAVGDTDGGGILLIKMVGKTFVIDNVDISPTFGLIAKVNGLVGISFLNEDNLGR